MKSKSINRAIVACAMIFAISMSIQAETVTRLVVWGKDGQKASYELTESPKVRFVDDNLSLTMGDDTEVTVPMSNVSKVTYETVESETTAIDDLTIGNEGIVSDGNNLVFNLQEGDNPIEIVNMQGVVLVSTILRGNGERVYPLMGLPSGAYVVKFNGLTYKIVKQ